MTMPTCRLRPSFTRCPTTLRPAQGIGLIEVLIALIIVAIGMLGIAGLQFMSKRSNFEAVQRTTASMLAQDIVERMRANRAAISTYAGTLENLPEPLGGGTMGEEPSPSCGSSASKCDPAQMAVHDLWQWEQAIDGVTEQQDGAPTGGLTLPTACLYSTVSDTAGDRSGRYIVAIAWRGLTEMANPTNPASPAPTPDPYACGQGSGKYNGEGGDDTHRRILIVETYVNAKID